MTESEYLTAARIIQAFWFISTLVMTASMIVYRCYFKKEIHPDPEEEIQQQPAIEKKYIDKPAVPGDHGNEEKDDLQNNSHDGIQSQTGSLPVQNQLKALPNAIAKGIDATIEKTPPMRFIRFVERIYNDYLLMATVAILVVGQFASYAFAIFCIFAYFISIILFNECEVQTHCDQQCAKGMFHLIRHVWLISLFVNFLVYEESQ